MLTCRSYGLGRQVSHRVAACSGPQSWAAGLLFTGGAAMVAEQEVAILRLQTQASEEVQAWEVLGVLQRPRSVAGGSGWLATCVAWTLGLAGRRHLRR
jgi:hypothetical protein